MKKNNILIAIFFFISYLILDKIIDYIFDYFEIIDGVGSFTFGFSNILLLSFIFFKNFI